MPSNSSLAGLRFVLVGPGRVGWSLTRWALDRGAGLVAVAGRSRRRARAAGFAIAPEGHEVDASLPLDAPWRALSESSFSDGAWRDVDLLLVAVADSALAEVARDLAAPSKSIAETATTGTTEAPHAPVVLHTSGLHDAEVLAPLRAVGCEVGSLHPLMAFPRALTSPGPRPPLFAVDGDPAALALARRLADAFGGRHHEIHGRRRLLYHLAATVAAGGVSTLLSVVESLLERADLPRELLPAYFDLARGALDHAAATRPVADAITGPAARGDAATVERQLAALAEVAPELHEVIATVHGETVRQRRRRVAAEPS